MKKKFENHISLTRDCVNAKFSFHLSKTKMIIPAQLTPHQTRKMYYVYLFMQLPIVLHSIRGNFRLKRELTYYTYTRRKKSYKNIPFTWTNFLCLLGKKFCLAFNRLSSWSAHVVLLICKQMSTFLYLVTRQFFIYLNLMKRVYVFETPVLLLIQFPTFYLV